MYKKEKLVENQFTWPICKDLLFLVLEDKVSDVFVCELVWERLFYTKEISINNNTTGTIVDTFGYPQTSFDRIKVKIDTGGTLTPGSASTITFSSFVGDTSGLKINKSTDGEVIDGGFQAVGHGVYVRFSEGVYTADDEWEVEVSGLDHTSGGGINSIQLKRR